MGRQVMEHGVTTARLAMLAAFLGAVCVLAPACSSAPPGCDSSLCPKGSACVDDGSGPGGACHRVCTSQAQCPAGTYCNDVQPVSWCSPSTLALTLGPGQWGTACSPAGGFDTNPACDLNDNFFCHGASPTDATAVCTYYDCIDDADCPGGWWCATIDIAPDVTTPQRSFGPTRTVCLQRQYCAPCRLDHDCSPAADGSQEHCVGQDATGAGFCSPQCATDDQCSLDASCLPQWGVCAARGCATDADCQANGSSQVCRGGACARPCSTAADCPASNGRPEQCVPGPLGSSCAPQACASDDDCPPTLGTFQHCNSGACTPECASDADCDGGSGDQTCVPLSVCVPRAGTCKGDGSFCSPCRSDADCGAGYCLESTYAKERFCSAAAMGTSCMPMTMLPKGTCPAPPPNAQAQMVACTTSPSAFAPANQCVGEVTFGTSAGQVQYDTGCWTINR